MEILLERILTIQPLGRLGPAKEWGRNFFKNVFSWAGHFFDTFMGSSFYMGGVKIR